MILPNISKFIKEHITFRDKSFFNEDLIRNDKKFCNGHYTAKKTMVNARENITKEDLIEKFNVSSKH